MNYQIFLFTMLFFTKGISVFSKLSRTEKNVNIRFSKYFFVKRYTQDIAGNRKIGKMSGLNKIECNSDKSESSKYVDISTNKEVKLKLDLENNNIFSNVFTNINLFENRSNIFTINNKTYMLKYNNHLNEHDFSISYYEKVGDEFVNISPWHHIPLTNDDGTYNMVVEISKYTYTKLEVNLKSPYNPITQDLKKGKLRYYNSAIYWNYGAIPQTYEYKKHIYKCLTKNNEHIYLTGDSDPLDIVDIGHASLKIGQVVPVKILGAFTLIDQGEMDWKIIAINKEDKHFDHINSIEDIDKYYPSTVNMLLEWFRYYKLPDTKKFNIITKEWYNKKQSEELITNTHKYYLEFLKDMQNMKENKNASSTKTEPEEDTTCITDIDDEAYNSLMQGVQISYHKARDSYKLNPDVWVP